MPFWEDKKCLSQKRTYLSGYGSPRFLLLFYRIVLRDWVVVVGHGQRNEDAEVGVLKMEGCPPWFGRRSGRSYKDV
jgi:hypothetical protein